MFPLITHSKIIRKSVTVFQMKVLDMYFLQITLVLKYLKRFGLSGRLKLGCNFLSYFF